MKPLQITRLLVAVFLLSLSPVGLIQASACPLEVDSAYKTPATTAVYYITNDCTKRPFNSEDAFFSYFDSWDAVHVRTHLSDVSLDALGFMPKGPRYTPAPGTLMKTVNDAHVYVVLNGEVRWIESEQVFNALGYRWNWVEDVDPRVIDQFERGGAVVDTAVHPNYSVIQYVNSPKVFWLKPDLDQEGAQVAVHIPDEATFNELGFRWDRIIQVNAGLPSTLHAETETTLDQVAEHLTYENQEALQESGDQPELIMAIYDIEGDQATFVGYGPGAEVWPIIAKDHDLQQAVWRVFADMIPREEREEIRYLTFFSDGPDQFMAYVDRSLAQPNEWTFAVDLADFRDPEGTFDKVVFIETLLHEFVHVLTLKTTQVDPIYERTNTTGAFDGWAYCNDLLYTGDGCAREGSYIQAFYEQFWKGPMITERQRIDKIADQTSYDQANERFFVDHDDDFVTSYASVSVEEDIAETLPLFFILDRPSQESLGTIDRQKIEFFWHYPELVRLRQQIRSNLLR